MVKDYQINTKILLKGLNNEPLEIGETKENVPVGKTIANILLRAKNKDPIKCYLLAQKFYEEEILKIDMADLDLVKKIIKSDVVVTPLISGQLLLLLSDSSK